MEKDKISESCDAASKLSGGGRDPALRKSSRGKSARPQCVAPVVQRPISRVEWAFFGLIFLGAAALRFTKMDLGWFSLHAARDYYRALELLRGENFPLLGSEILYGGRTLGPLMYLLCAGPLAIRVNVLLVGAFLSALDLAALAMFWLGTRRYFGVAVALIASGFYAVFPLHVMHLRFYWNPAFLPILVLGAWFLLLAASVRRRHWALVGVAALIGLGLQLHLSVGELVVSAALILAISRPGVPVRVWAAAALAGALALSPAILHEIESRRSNVGEIVTAPVSKRPGMSRFQFNTSGPRNFFLHVRLQMNEDIERVGFCHLQGMADQGPKWLSGGEMALARGINWFGQIQLDLWGVGILVCAREIARYRRVRGALSGVALGRARSRMICHSALLVWQGIPVLAVAFFNFHGTREAPSLVIGLRYYMTTYPAPFITSALGAAHLARMPFWLDLRVARAWGRRAMYGLAAALCLSHIVFMILMLALMERSGRSIPYPPYSFYAPTLRSLDAVRDILLGEARLDAAAWYERVHGQQLGDIWFGETTLDWLITQDARSVTNPPPDAHLRWLLHAPFVLPGIIESPEPRLPEGAREIRRWQLGKTGFSVIEYRVEDPSAPMPDNTNLRNYYFRTERMRYLGPERELRALSASRNAKHSQDQKNAAMPASKHALDNGREPGQTPSKRSSDLTTQPANSAQPNPLKDEDSR